MGTIDGVNKAADIEKLGKGYLVLETSKQFTNEWGEVTSYNVVDKIICIGDKEIANWRSMEKLEPTEIKSDVDLSNGSVSEDLWTCDTFLIEKIRH